MKSYKTAITVCIMPTGAELVIAKLDRLSRNISFIVNIMEDKRVRLRVAFMPIVDNFQLHIYAALAEQEREFIFRRQRPRGGDVLPVLSAPIS